MQTLEMFFRNLLQRNSEGSPKSLIGIDFVMTEVFSNFRFQVVDVCHGCILYKSLIILADYVIIILTSLLRYMVILGCNRDDIWMKTNNNFQRIIYNLKRIFCQMSWIDTHDDNGLFYAC